MWGGWESPGDGLGDVKRCDIRCCGENEVQRVDEDTSVVEMQGAQIFECFGTGEVCCEARSCDVWGILQ